MKVTKTIFMSFAQKAFFKDYIDINTNLKEKAGRKEVWKNIPTGMICSSLGKLMGNPRKRKHRNFVKSKN